MTNIKSVADHLSRAVELGREIGRIGSDRMWHGLSRNAWTIACLRLGGWTSLEAMAAARARLEQYPHLRRETSILAELWRRGGQDRPALSPIFTDAEREGLTAAYHERLHAGLSPAECSAIAAMLCAEARPDSTFGGLEFWTDLDAKLAPLERELAHLDQVLARLVSIAAIEWRNNVPTLSAEGIVVPINETSARMIATEFAVQARLRIHETPLAA